MPRHQVALAVAALAAGGVLLGSALCAVAGTGGTGWPDERGWAGFFILLASAFGLVVALVVLALGALHAAGQTEAAVVLAALGAVAAVSGFAFGGGDLVLLGILGVAVVVAAPLAALQAWLWRRRGALPPQPDEPREPPPP